MNLEMQHKVILRVVSKFLIPFILLFALYVQWHGDFGPGGGFQAGIIFASAFIVYGLIFGVKQLRRVVPVWVTRNSMALGVLLYSGVGVASMIMGGNFLEYNALAQDPVAGQHVGILLVELGVGITVASAMITIFVAFAGQNR